MPPVDATAGAASVGDATVEEDAMVGATVEEDVMVGATVSLATLPVDATKVAALGEATDEDFIDDWISDDAKLTVLSIEDDVVESEDAVGRIVVEGDEPVDATKVSAVLEVVAESSVFVVESLVAAAAASSAVEGEAVEKRCWKSDDDVEEGSWDSERKEEMAWNHEFGVEVEVSASEKVEEVEELVVFCKAFCLFKGRGK
jgi:hypothetical protein